jgi:hypothetical protein
MISTRGVLCKGMQIGFDAFGEHETRVATFKFSRIEFFLIQNFIMNQ